MENMISLEEAKKIAGVSSVTIWSWCNQKKFSFERAVNRRLWIDKESFLSFIKKVKEERNK